MSFAEDTTAQDDMSASFSASTFESDPNDPWTSSAQGALGPVDLTTILCMKGGRAYEGWTPRSYEPIVTRRLMRALSLSLSLSLSP